LFYNDEFGEITQNKGHYAVQGHSRSPILVQIDFLLAINTNLPHILHHFRDIAFNRSKNRYILLPLLRLILPMEQFPISYHRKWYIAKNYITVAESLGISLYLQPLLCSVPWQLPNSLK